HGAPGADLAQRPHSGPQHAAGRPVVVPLPRLHGVAALLGPRYRARARVLAARGADFRSRPGRLSRGRDRRVLARTTPPRRLAARAREQGLRELPPTYRNMARAARLRGDSLAADSLFARAARLPPP